MSNATKRPPQRTAALPHRPSRPATDARRAATWPASAVGRRMIGLALLVVVAAGAVVSSGGITPAVAFDGQAAASAGAMSMPDHVVLGEGDTVWDVAGPFRPEGTELQTWIRQVVELNEFDVTALPPGTVVRLP